MMSSLLSLASSSSSSNETGRKQLSIHKIRDIPLETINIETNYKILREIGCGDYGKVILAIHKSSHSEVALKAVPKCTTPLKDFLLEFHYSYFLSPHHNILDTYDVAFETIDHYYFAQEVAPFGDLAQVKLTDFGLTRRVGTLVKKRVKSLPTCPPEVWQAVLLEGYHIETGSDVWQLAVMICIMLTTKFPWEKADITDTHFTEFVEWQKRKLTRTPRYFRDFTPRALRMFRRLMEIKPSKRYPVTEIRKYLTNDWISKKVFTIQK
ncbi:testis-specific serine/threonine-protein kinase 1 [Sarcoptes scabiei]|nr:testis-specific serine/threonine-protein kinase 1 [Sarcoptes scabiei]